MARGAKTGGRQKGSLNKRTVGREKLGIKKGTSLATLHKIEIKLLDMAEVAETPAEKRQCLSEAGRIATARLPYEESKMPTQTQVAVTEPVVHRLEVVFVGGTGSV